MYPILQLQVPLIVHIPSFKHVMSPPLSQPMSKYQFNLKFCTFKHVETQNNTYITYELIVGSFLALNFVRC